ncbi:hypothetical protein QCA50_015523 [Cerrena zonata]|uniref:BTB domain-containing protein n=1 Tax=Cerrena zonata TaxID=2478898 RepID=A0AAW0FL20_9APHY
MFNFSQAVARQEQTLHVDPSQPNQALSLPVIDVEEPSSTIKNLLSIYYPVDEVMPTSLDNVVDVFKAALKYEMHKAITRMRQHLVTYIPADPLSVYAKACTLDLEDEACQAAKEWRKQSAISGSLDRCGHCGHTRSRDGVPRPPSSAPSNPFSSSVGGKAYWDDMREITAGQFYRLISFVKSGVETTFCSPPPRSDKDTPLPEKPRDRHPLPPNPDIVIQSNDNVYLPAHTVILDYASASMILETPRLPDLTVKGLPVIKLDEDGDTLDTLLRLCYPFAHYEVTSKTCTVSHISNVRKTAQRYEMANVGRLARDVMEDLIKTQPMEVYFAANRYGWRREMKLAETQRSVLTDIEGPDSYVGEMEFVSAEVYYHLLKSWYAKRTN